jgi:hypothetical protein
MMVMEAEKQMITAIQRGPICDFEQELESPMNEGLYLPGVTYLEMRKVNNYGGARIRIMKGFWVGGGQSKSHDEQTEIDKGYLNISQKELVFAGQSTTISIPLKQIIRIQPYVDGIGIFKDGRQKGYSFLWGESIDMKLVNVKGDDGEIKLLRGEIIETYINYFKRL